MFHQLIESIIHSNPSEIKQRFQDVIKLVLEQKLYERKRMIAAEIFEPIDTETEILDEKINNNVIRTGRTKLVKIRVRAGKVQRRKKLSNTKGYTIRGGRLVRMSAIERRHRKMGARRAKVKRRAERSQIRRKTRIALRQRHSLGL